MIKRYHIFDETGVLIHAVDAGVEKADNGYWVTHEDHLKANEWISVESKYPEPGIIVNVTDGITVTAGIFIRESYDYWETVDGDTQKRRTGHTEYFELFQTDSMAYFMPTHWQPLPTPPTSKEE